MQVFDLLKAALFSSVIAPAVWLIFIAAFLYFLWGVVRYIWNGNDPAERANGRQHMLWGIVGIAIMISAFALAAFVFNSIVAVGGPNGIDGKPIKTPSILQSQNQAGF